MRRKATLLPRRELLIAGVGLLATWGRSQLAAQEGQEGIGEYDVKAAFLYNFAKFTEWPQSFLGARSAPVLVGVVGDDPFGPLLERTFDGKTLRGREFRIRRFPTIGELELCHILFIRMADKRQLEQVLHTVAASPVLTVGEDAEFVRLGGVVKLVLQSSKVRFEINAAAAERSGLKISSQLLKLAREVYEG